MRAKAAALVTVPEREPALELAQALARVLALEPVLAKAKRWATGRSGRVRHCHKWSLREPQPQGIPLIAKSVERSSI